MKTKVETLYQIAIEFIQYLPMRQGRRSPGLKVWDTEMIRKSCQNSVSLHFGTPEPDKHNFNGELVLHYDEYGKNAEP